MVGATHREPHAGPCIPSMPGAPVPVSTTGAAGAARTKHRCCASCQARPHRRTLPGSNPSTASFDRRSSRMAMRWASSTASGTVAVTTRPRSPASSAVSNDTCMRVQRKGRGRGPGRSRARAWQPPPSGRSRAAPPPPHLISGVRRSRVRLLGSSGLQHGIVNSHVMPACRTLLQFPRPPDPVMARSTTPWQRKKTSCQIISGPRSLKHLP